MVITQCQTQIYTGSLQGTVWLSTVQTHLFQVASIHSINKSQSSYPSKLLNPHRVYAVAERKLYHVKGKIMVKHQALKIAVVVGLRCSNMQV